MEKLYTEVIVHTYTLVVYCGFVCVCVCMYVCVCVCVCDIISAYECIELDVQNII